MNGYGSAEHQHRLEVEGEVYILEWMSLQGPVLVKSRRLSYDSVADLTCLPVVVDESVRAVNKMSEALSAVSHAPECSTQCSLNVMTPCKEASAR